MLEIDESDVWEALRIERRRWAVKRVQEEGTINLGVLADIRAEEEFGQMYDAGDRQAVYVSYYQGHLDKLDSAGLVDYDPRSGDVQANENTKFAAHLIRAVEDQL